MGKYIKETARLDPPVTSACQQLRKDASVTLAGYPFTFPVGSLNQYVVAMANRDRDAFRDPVVFNPLREDLDKSFTWNGAFGEGDPAADEAKYPRICPGRYL